MRSALPRPAQQAARRIELPTNNKSGHRSPVEHGAEGEQCTRRVWLPVLLAKRLQCTFRVPLSARKRHRRGDRRCSWRRVGGQCTFKEPWCRRGSNKAAAQVVPSMSAYNSTRIYGIPCELARPFPTAPALRTLGATWKKLCAGAVICVSLVGRQSQRWRARTGQCCKSCGHDRLERLSQATEPERRVPPPTRMAFGALGALGLPLACTVDGQQNSGRVEGTHGIAIVRVPSNAYNGPRTRHAVWRFHIARPIQCFQWPVASLTICAPGTSCAPAGFTWPCSPTCAGIRVHSGAVLQAAAYRFSLICRLEWILKPYQAHSRQRRFAKPLRSRVLTVARALLWGHVFTTRLD